MSRRVLILLLIAWMARDSAASQTKPEPPRRTLPPRSGALPTDTTARQPQPLPAIELPEYDITGKLIPGVADAEKSRSGSEGALDPLGRGTIRSREGGWTDPSLWKEGASLSVAAGPKSARVGTGYGSFRSPFVEGSFRSGGDDYRYSVSGNYAATGGHVDFADEKWGRLGASLGWRVESDGPDKPSIGLSAAYSGRSYHPFGSLRPFEGRSFNRFSAGVQLSDLAVGEIRMSGKATLGSASIAGDQTLRHTRLALEGRGELDLRGIRLNAGAEGSFSSFANVAGTSGPYLIRVTLLAGKDLTEDLRLQGGISATTYRGSEPGGQGRIFPLAAVTWFVSPQVDITLRYEPTVREGELESLGGENPYLVYSTELRHEVAGTDLALTTQFTPDTRFRVRLVTQYRRFSPYLALIDTAGKGLWETYGGGRTELFALRGDLLWELTPSDLFTLTIRGYASENSETGASVPYIPSVRGECTYLHRFGFGLLASADLQMIGSRTSDLGGAVRLDPFVLVAASLEYPILPGFRVRGRIGNLLGVRHEWWEGYNGIPRNGGLSLSYSW